MFDIIATGKQREKNKRKGMRKNDKLYRSGR